MPTEPSVHVALQAAHDRVGAQTVRHPHFEATASRLRETVSCHPLSLLLGVPGVGKTVLVRALVAELNRSVSDPSSQLRAVAVTAPTRPWPS